MELQVNPMPLFVARKSIVDFIVRASRGGLGATS
jgi:hypothetical protein